MASSDPNGLNRNRHDALSRVADDVLAFDDEHRCTYADDGAAQLLDFDPETLLDTSIWDAFPESWGSAARDAVEQAVETGRPSTFERYSRERDGQFEIRVYPDETGVTVCICEATDPTKRERDLNRAETVFQNAQDGLFVIDVEDDGETFRMNRVNRAYESLTEASMDELRRKTVREIAGETDGAAVREKYRKCVADRTEQTYEEQISIFGRESWWETSIAPVIVEDEVVQLVGSTRKITQRKEREKQLRKFEQMVTASGHAVFFTDVDGVIQYVNPAFERMTGYTSAAAVGRQPSFLRSGEHDDEFFTELWETILNGEVWTGEIVNERRDGTQFVSKHTIAPVTNDAGDVTNFVAIYDDITDQKEREQRLRTQEVIIQSMNEVAFLVDEEKRIQFANEAAQEFADISLSTIKGMPIEPVTEEMAAPNSDPRRFLDALDAILEGTTPDVGEWVQSPSGTETLSLEFDLSLDSVGYVNAEQRFVPVELYDGSRGVAVISRDITERKQKEEEIQTHLVQAQEIGNVGSWHLDLETEDLHWSEEAYRIFGIGREQPMTYQRFLDAVHPADTELVTEEWAAALEGETYDFEHRIVVDGETKWVHERAEVEFDDDGEAISGIGVVRDITEQVEREREINGQRRRYVSLFNSIRDPIAVTDTDGRVTNCNPGFTERFGYELDDIKGAPLRRLLADVGDETALLAVGNDNVEPLDSKLEVEYRTKCGDEFPGESTVSRFRDHEGTVVGVVNHIRDISESRKNRQQIQVVDRILRHNIRNSMNVLMGRAEMVQANGSTEIQPDIDTILEVSRKFVDTAEKQRKITSVLTDPPEIASRDVVSTVESIVAEIADLYPAAEVDATLPAEFQVRATYDIDEALGELIRNAVVHSEAEHPTVTVDVRHNDGSAEIRVIDTGPEIPEMESNILTQQAEIEPLYHGSGLGLWLVHEIVRQSDGRVALEKNNSEGSTVAVFLPAV